MFFRDRGSRQTIWVNLKLPFLATWLVNISFTSPFTYGWEPDSFLSGKMDNLAVFQPDVCQSNWSSRYGPTSLSIFIKMRISDFKVVMGITNCVFSNIVRLAVQAVASTRRWLRIRAIMNLPV